jgi:hypothetical protein
MSYWHQATVYFLIGEKAWLYKEDQMAAIFEKPPTTVGVCTEHQSGCVSLSAFWFDVCTEGRHVCGRVCKCA